MPILDPGESWEPIVDYYNRRAAQNTEQEQGRELRIDDRVRMARNLALGFRAVHAAGYVIGDVNEKNVEVNRQNDIAMVDCDSYGFTDSGTGRAFSNRMGRPEFQAPEVQGDYSNRSQDHDRFGLAVVIFHLLTGYHPYTVTNQPDYPLPGDRIKAWLFPPARRGVSAPDPYRTAWNTLTSQQQELFRRCFDQRFQGQSRPTPEEWVEALLEMPDVVRPPTGLPRKPSFNGLYINRRHFLIWSVGAHAARVIMLEYVETGTSAPTRCVAGVATRSLAGRSSRDVPIAEVRMLVCAVTGIFEAAPSGVVSATVSSAVLTRYCPRRRWG